MLLALACCERFLYYVVMNKNSETIMKIITSTLLAFLMTGIIASAHAQSMREARKQLQNDAYSQAGLCDYYIRQCPDKFARYNEAAQKIQDRVKSKSLTPIEAGNEIQDLAKAMYPKDGLLMSMTQQQAAMARILDYSTLPVKQREELEKAASKTFSYALEERFALMASIKTASEEIKAERVPAAPTTQVVYVEGNSAVNDAIPAAVFLNKVGQAFSTSYGQYLQPMPMCSYGRGTVMCY